MHVSGARYLFHRLRKYQSSNLKSVFPLDHVLNLYTQHLHQSCEKIGKKRIYRQRNMLAEKGIKQGQQSPQTFRQYSVNC